VLIWKLVFRQQRQQEWNCLKRNRVSRNEKNWQLFVCSRPTLSNYSPHTIDPKDRKPRDDMNRGHLDQRGMSGSEMWLLRWYIAECLNYVAWLTGSDPKDRKPRDDMNRGHLEQRGMSGSEMWLLRWYIAECLNYVAWLPCLEVSCWKVKVGR